MIKNEVDYDQFKDSFTPSVQDKKKGTKKKKSSKKNSISSIQSRFSSFFSNKDVLQKIGITLFVVALYRLLIAIPLPGIDMSVYQEFFGAVPASEASYLLLIFTGGTLDSPSIVGMGILAFINASIIIQLLTPVIPKLTELSKEGAQGQQVINQYTRYLTLPLAVLYAVVYVLLISRRDLNSPDGFTPSDNPVYLVEAAAGSDWPSITKVIFMSLVLTAGTMLLMWLAEYITEKGIGNGSSIIITVGILSSLPSLLSRDLATFDLGILLQQIFAGSFGVLTSSTMIAFLTIFLGGVLLTGAIVFVNESIRNIKIQQTTRRVVGSGQEQSVLPIKLTMTGVLPIIFASSLLALPQIVIPLLSQIQGSEFVDVIVNSLENSFLLASTDTGANLNDVWYALFYFALIVAFGVFYAFIAMKPDDIAENLQKSGRYVPGIRPGNATRKYITNVIGRIGFAGAVFLGLVAMIPLLANTVIQTTAGVSVIVLTGIGGTSILIVVSVLLEIIRQYNALKVSRSYDQYA